jgi:hypothetical protein
VHHRQEGPAKKNFDAARLRSRHAPKLDEHAREIVADV